MSICRHKNLLSSPSLSFLPVFFSHSSILLLPSLPLSPLPPLSPSLSLLRVRLSSLHPPLWLCYPLSWTDYIKLYAADLVLCSQTNQAGKQLTI